jgi:hypothetical protein
MDEFFQGLLDVVSAPVELLVDVIDATLDALEG